MSITTTLLAALVLQVTAHQHAPEHTPEFTPPADDQVPLYDNLGSHAYRVTTANDEVQAYFDQGLRLYYAFNHAEAVRSFREAQRLDPSCAMCWWGEAIAFGPNINLPMDSTAGVAAYTASRRALEELDRESAVERALIEALGTRYVEVPGPDRAALDSAYARAMANVARRFPADPEAAALSAEAIMDLSPWAYWNADGSPRPGTERALDALEDVMRSNASHPGACHFYIHAVEAVDPDRALPCAERLAALMPGAGHLVHMPGHIYIRVGRYADAIAANEHAVHADESWIQDQRPGMGVYTAGYYPHNYDFLAFAASMAGRRDQATQAADRVRDLIPAEMFGVPGMAFLEHWWARPLQIRVRFGLWDDILATDAPADGLSHARALWHYARGRAFVARGEIASAARELGHLRSAAAGPSLEGMRMEFNAATDILAIAEHVLEGLVAEAGGDAARAIDLLREAAALEDAMTYGEPPEWSVPVRHDLGAVLLRARRSADAEAVYREDLARFRENGWALKGLAQALRAQGRPEEAREVEARFRRAWDTADVKLPTSSF